MMLLCLWSLCLLTSLFFFWASGIFGDPIFGDIDESQRYDAFASFNLSPVEKEKRALLGVAFQRASGLQGDGRGAMRSLLSFAEGLDHPEKFQFYDGYNSYDLGQVFHQFNATHAAVLYRRADPKSATEQAKNLFTFIILISLAALWILFLAFFNSRVLAFLIMIIVRWRLKTRENGIYIDLGSIALSLFAGAIQFRRLTYVDQDFALTVVDGEIVVRYWTTKYRTSLNIDPHPSRLTLQLNGLSVHFYNKTAAYQRLLDITNELNNKGSVSFAHADDSSFTGSEKTPPVPNSASFASAQPGRRASMHNKPSKLPSPPTSSSWALRFKDLFPVVRIRIGVGRVLVGNRLLPSTFNTVFQSATLLYSVTKENDLDQYTWRLSGRLTKLKSRLYPNPQWRERSDFCPPRYVPLFKDPKDKTRDKRLKKDLGIKIAELEFNYRVDMPGPVVSANETSPLWELDIKSSSRNSEVVIGANMLVQRGVLVNFFFPYDFQDLETTPQPIIGSSRLCKELKVSVEFTQPFRYYVAFMQPPLRDGSSPEIGFVEAIVKYSKFDVRIPMIVQSSGYQISFKADFSSFIPGQATETPVEHHHGDLDFDDDEATLHDGLPTAAIGEHSSIKVTTSLPLPELIDSCKSIKVSAIMNTPLRWADHRFYSFEIDLEDPTIKFVKTQIPFFSALVDAITQSSSLTPSYLDTEFFPVIYDYRMRMHNYHLFWCTNDYNVINESPQPSSSDRRKDSPPESMNNQLFNSFIDTYGAEASMIVSTRSDSFEQPERQTLYQFNFGSFNANLHLPLWHTLSSTIPNLSSFDICKCESLEIQVATFFHSLSPGQDPSDLVDKVFVSISGSKITIPLHGYVAKHMFNLYSNYFGNSIPLILQTGKKEFKSFEYRPSGAFIESSVTFNLDLSQVHLGLPTNLYTDADQTLPLNLNFDNVHFAMIAAPLQFDLDLNISGIALMFQQVAAFNPDGLDEEYFGKGLVHVDHVKMERSFMLIGPRINGSTKSYACAYPLAIGPVSGVLTLNQISQLISFAECFGYHFADLDNFQLDPYPFLRQIADAVPVIAAMPSPPSSPPTRRPSASADHLLRESIHEEPRNIHPSGSSPSTFIVITEEEGSEVDQRGMSVHSNSPSTSPSMPEKNSHFGSTDQLSPSPSKSEMIGKEPPDPIEGQLLRPTRSRHKIVNRIKHSLLQPSVSKDDIRVLRTDRQSDPSAGFQTGIQDANNTGALPFVGLELCFESVNLMLTANQSLACVFDLKEGVSLKSSSYLHPEDGAALEISSGPVVVTQLMNINLCDPLLKQLYPDLGSGNYMDEWNAFACLSFNLDIKLHSAPQADVAACNQSQVSYLRRQDASYRRLAFLWSDAPGALKSAPDLASLYSQNPDFSIPVHHLFEFPGSDKFDEWLLNMEHTIPALAQRSRSSGQHRVTRRISLSSLRPSTMTSSFFNEPLSPLSNWAHHHVPSTSSIKSSSIVSGPHAQPHHFRNHTHRGPAKKKPTPPYLSHRSDSMLYEEGNLMEMVELKKQHSPVLEDMIVHRPKLKMDDDLLRETNVDEIVPVRESPSSPELMMDYATHSSFLSSTSASNRGPPLRPTSLPSDFHGQGDDDDDAGSENDGINDYFDESAIQDHRYTTREVLLSSGDSSPVNHTDSEPHSSFQEDPNLRRSSSTHSVDSFQSAHSHISGDGVAGGKRVSLSKKPFSRNSSASRSKEDTPQPPQVVNLGDLSGASSKQPSRTPSLRQNSTSFGLLSPSLSSTVSSTTTVSTSSSSGTSLYDHKFDDDADDEFAADNAQHRHVNLLASFASKKLRPRFKSAFDELPSVAEKEKRSSGARPQRKAGSNSPEADKGHSDDLSEFLPVFLLDPVPATNAFANSVYPAGSPNFVLQSTLFPIVDGSSRSDPILTANRPHMSANDAFRGHSNPDQSSDQPPTFAKIHLCPLAPVRLFVTPVAVHCWSQFVEAITLPSEISSSLYPQYLDHFQFNFMKGVQIIPKKQNSHVAEVHGKGLDFEIQVLQHSFIHRVSSDPTSISEPTASSGNPNVSSRLAFKGACILGVAIKSLSFDLEFASRIRNYSRRPYESPILRFSPMIDRINFNVNVGSIACQLRTTPNLSLAAKGIKPRSAPDSSPVDHEADLMNHLFPNVFSVTLAICNTSDVDLNFLYSTAAMEESTEFRLRLSPVFADCNLDSISTVLSSATTWFHSSSMFGNSIEATKRFNSSMYRSTLLEILSLACTMTGTPVAKASKIDQFLPRSTFTILPITTDKNWRMLQYLRRVLLISQSKSNAGNQPPEEVRPHRGVGRLPPGLASPTLIRQGSVNFLENNIQSLPSWYTGGDVVLVFRDLLNGVQVNEFVSQHYRFSFVVPQCDLFLQSPTKLAAQALRTEGGHMLFDATFFPPKSEQNIASAPTGSEKQQQPTPSAPPPSTSSSSSTESNLSLMKLQVSVHTEKVIHNLSADALILFDAVKLQSSLVETLLASVNGDLDDSPEVSQPRTSYSASRNLAEQTAELEAKMYRTVTAERIAQLNEALFEEGDISSLDSDDEERISTKSFDIAQLSSVGAYSDGLDRPRLGRRVSFQDSPSDSRFPPIRLASSLRAPMRSHEERLKTISISTLFRVASVSQESHQVIDGQVIFTVGHFETATLSRSIRLSVTAMDVGFTSLFNLKPKAQQPELASSKKTASASSIRDHLKLRAYAPVELDKHILQLGNFDLLMAKLLFQATHEASSKDLKLGFEPRTEIGSCLLDGPHVHLLYDNSTHSCIVSVGGVSVNVPQSLTTFDQFVSKWRKTSKYSNFIINQNRISMLGTPSVSAADDEGPFHPLKALKLETVMVSLRQIHVDLKVMSTLRCHYELSQILATLHQNPYSINLDSEIQLGAHSLTVVTTGQEQTQQTFPMPDVIVEMKLKGDGSRRPSGSRPSSTGVFRNSSISSQSAPIFGSPDVQGLPEKYILEIDATLGVFELEVTTKMLTQLMVLQSSFAEEFVDISRMSSKSRQKRRAKKLIAQGLDPSISVPGPSRLEVRVSASLNGLRLVATTTFQSSLSLQIGPTLLSIQSSRERTHGEVEIVPVLEFGVLTPEQRALVPSPIAKFESRIKLEVDVNRDSSLAFSAPRLNPPPQGNRYGSSSSVNPFQSFFSVNINDPVLYCPPSCIHLAIMFFLDFKASYSFWNSHKKQHSSIPSDDHESSNSPGPLPKPVSQANISSADLRTAPHDPTMHGAPSAQRQANASSIDSVSQAKSPRPSPMLKRKSKQSVVSEIVEPKKMKIYGKFVINRFLAYAPLHTSDSSSSSSKTPSNTLAISMELCVVKVENEGSIGEFKNLGLQVVPSFTSVSTLFSRLADPRTLNTALAPKGTIQVYSRSAQPTLSVAVRAQFGGLHIRVDPHIGHYIGEFSHTVEYIFNRLSLVIPEDPSDPNSKKSVSALDFHPELISLRHLANQQAEYLQSIKPSPGTHDTIILVKRQLQETKAKIAHKMNKLRKQFAAQAASSPGRSLLNFDLNVILDVTSGECALYSSPGTSSTWSNAFSRSFSREVSEEERGSASLHDTLASSIPLPLLQLKLVYQTNQGDLREPLLNSTVFVHSPNEEVKFSPRLLDFIVETEKNKQLFMRSIKSEASAYYSRQKVQDYGSKQNSSDLPFHYNFYLHLYSPVVNFSCQPISPIECRLALPSINFFASSKNEANAKLESVSVRMSGLNMSISHPATRNLGARHPAPNSSSGNPGPSSSSATSRGSSKHPEALKLVLDEIIFNMSRRSTPLEPPFFSIVGSTEGLNLFYDTNQLKDLLVFKKCWYDKNTLVQFFFGSYGPSEASTGGRSRSVTDPYGLDSSSEDESDMLSANTSFSDPKHPAPSNTGNVSGGDTMSSDPSSDQPKPSNANILYIFRVSDFAVHTNLGKVLGNNSLRIQNLALQGSSVLDVPHRHQLRCTCETISLSDDSKQGIVNVNLVLSDLSFGGTYLYFGSNPIPARHVLHFVEMKAYQITSFVRYHDPFVLILNARNCALRLHDECLPLVGDQFTSSHSDGVDTHSADSRDDSSVFMATQIPEADHFGRSQSTPAGHTLHASSSSNHLQPKYEVKIDMSLSSDFVHAFVSKHTYPSLLKIYDKVLAMVGDQYREFQQELISSRVFAKDYHHRREAAHHAHVVKSSQKKLRFASGSIHLKGDELLVAFFPQSFSDHTWALLTMSKYRASYNQLPLAPYHSMIKHRELVILLGESGVTRESQPLLTLHQVGKGSSRGYDDSNPGDWFELVSNQKSKVSILAIPRSEFTLSSKCHSQTSVVECVFLGTFHSPVTIALDGSLYLFLGNLVSSYKKRTIQANALLKQDDPLQPIEPEITGATQPLAPVFRLKNHVFVCEVDPNAPLGTSTAPRLPPSSHSDEDADHSVPHPTHGPHCRFSLNPKIKPTSYGNFTPPDLDWILVNLCGIKEPHVTINHAVYTVLHLPLCSAVNAIAANLIPPVSSVSDKDKDKPVVSATPVGTGNLSNNIMNINNPSTPTPTTPSTSNHGLSVHSSKLQSSRLSASKK